MRWLLRLRVFIIIFLAVVLISAAVIFSVVRAVLPHATAYKNEISQEISRQIGFPVEIESIDAAIYGFSPRLRLIGVSVFDEDKKSPLFTFRETFVELDFLSSIRRGEVVIADVGLVGAHISIEKFSDSEWAIQGIKIIRDGETDLPDQLLYFLQNADYLLHDSSIHYQDHSSGKSALNLSAVNITVENHNNKHAIKFSVNLSETYGHSLVMVANLYGGFTALSGDIFIETSQLKMKQWNHKFNFWRTHQLDAIADVDLWITLNNNNVQSVITQLAATNFSISNKITNKQWETDYLSTKIRYFNNNENWNIAISDFYFGQQAQPAWLKPVSVIAGYDNEHYHLSADFLRVEDVQAMAEVFLSKDKSPDVDKLMQFKIQADIYNLNLKLPSESTQQQLLEHLYLDATVIDFSMLDSKSNNEISGLDASLHYKNKRAEINIASQDSVFVVKNLFREPLFATTLRGDLIVDYQDDKWQLSSNRLQLKNQHINTFSRFNIQTLSAKNIFVDAQTNFYDANGKHVRHYLPVGIMQPALVDWLDMAVTDGYIAAGSFILQGKLNDFPYYQDKGVFQVMFPLKNAKMKFLDDWPLLTETSATLKFHNQSLFVSGVRTKTEGTLLTGGSVQILDLADAHLSINARTKAKTANMQSYVFNSPLDEVLGDALRLFQFDGDSRLSLQLEVPLNKEQINVEIDGKIQFLNTEMYFAELKYELSEINGMLLFSEDSISADSIKAKMNNQLLSINAVTQKGRSGRETVFQLNGIMQADYLLQTHDWLPEDWLSGESMWEIDIEIPYQAKDYLVHVKVDSLLQGVALQMSDQVQKKPDSKMHFFAELNILENQGLQIITKVSTATDKVSRKKPDVLFDLFAQRDETKLWRLNVDSEFITGKGSLTEGLGKDTSIKLDLETVDFYALFATKNNNKNQTQTLKPSDFPQLNWQAKKLLWDERVFTDVKVETNWHEHGMLIDRISLKAAAMTFDARGTWLASSYGLHESVLEGTMTSSNIGDTLAGLNFSRSLDHGSFNAEFKSEWSAMPHQLTWANMTGNVSFEMLDAEMRNVDPGAGRLLGLLNLFRLFDRLALDFDDITKEGFVFDSMKGDFEFVTGVGSLKNFIIKARAADISMFGSIGLLQQDYDLLMHVKPHTGSLTIAGGVLLGGVAVGATLALIQRVFDFSLLGHNVYSITGNWNDPVVERIIEQSVLDHDIGDDEDDF